MRTLFAAALLSTLVLAPAYADTRAVENQAFHAIDARGPYRLNIVAGAPAAHAIATGTADHLRDLDIRVVNGVLQIRRNCSGICNSNGARAVIDITAPTLDRVAIGYGADANVEHLAAGAFDASASMGSDLTLQGACGSLTAAASMGADLRADALRCESVHASASMGSDVSVFASRSIEARAGMGADIHVSGKPEQRELHGGLGGDVTID